VTLVLSNVASSHVPPSAFEPLRAALAGVLTLADQLVAPLFAKFGELAEATLLDMHRANSARDEPAGGAAGGDAAALPCSSYMSSLQTQLAYFANTTLARFAACELLGARALRLAQRLMLFATRHVALVRPLGGAGRLQLVADLTQLEAGLEPLLAHTAAAAAAGAGNGSGSGGQAMGVGALRAHGGAAYKRLRQLRAALFASSGVLAATERHAALGRLTALHLLFARAPPSLLSPHAALHWSIGRYSQYLDTARDVDVWRQIRDHCLPLADAASQPLVDAMLLIGAAIEADADIDDVDTTIDSQSSSSAVVDN
jgi:hypothetical protein